MPLSAQWEKNYLNLELVMIIITTVNMYLFTTYNWRYMLWSIPIMLGLNFMFLFFQFVVHMKLLDNLLAISTIICKTRHVHHNFLIMKYMLTICNILMKIYSKPDNIVPISLSHKAQHGETMQTCLSYQGKFKFDISASY